MKAIPSVYRDVTFRSRLEARWAALFDHYSVMWAYEPDAYDTPGGLYLPDFYLPQLHTFVEVKPGPNLFDVAAAISVAVQESASFLVLDSPIIACRSYPLWEGGFWTDMCWCMSQKYLGTDPHDLRQRFYVCTGSPDGANTRSGLCPACGAWKYGTYAEDPHFTRIRSMRFDRGRAL